MYHYQVENQDLDDLHLKANASFTCKWITKYVVSTIGQINFLPEIYDFQPWTHYD